MKSQREIKIMGIVNLNDDSFYAPSRTSRGNVLEVVGRMVKEGADIIDLGPCSSKPGSVPVGPEVEWQRLQGVPRLIRDNFPGVQISIDTSYSYVISRAFDEAGPVMVNDISAGTVDSGLLPLAGRLGLDFVAMHMRGTPQTMGSLTDYASVTREVLQYFRDFSIRADAAGVKSWILDPGFGFAKTVEQNYELLDNLEAFGALGRPVLVGLSRKSMIYKPLGIGPEDSLSGTQALLIAALERGADILRVHDVKAAAQTVKLYKMLTNSPKI